MRFLFVFSTILLGCFFQIVLGRYLSLFDSSPQVFLLLTLANGFLSGPIMGMVLGFSWGLIGDTMGLRLFGMNSFLLALAGFLAGSFRRRVASERFAAQITIALIATLYYAVGASTIYSMFDESPGRFSLFHFFLQSAYNAVFISVFFLFTEHWAGFWKIPQEDM